MRIFRASTIFMFMVCCGLFALCRFLIIDDLIPIYGVAIAIATAVYAAVIAIPRLRASNIDAIDPKAVEALRSAHEIILARREVRARVPRNAPRRESEAALGGLAKLTSARSMAMLIRKARLRETVMDICDMGELVLETIRRMPSDTPAAVTFCETHLGKLTEALEKCFEISRSENYKHAPESIDRQEIECFAAFVFAFHRQQGSILFESLASPKPVRGA